MIIYVSALSVLKRLQDVDVYIVLDVLLEL